MIGRLRGGVIAALQDPNPLLLKELRSTFRAKLFIRFLYVVTGLTVFAVLLLGAAVASESVPPAEVGVVLYQAFFMLAISVFSLVAPAYASTSFTSEREQQTFESLLLTGISPWRMVHGKFLATYFSMFLVFVAIAPVVGIAFLFGGVSPFHVLVAVVGFLLQLSYLIALGVAVSVRLSNTRLAIVATVLLVAPLVTGVITLITALAAIGQNPADLYLAGPLWFIDAVISPPEDNPSLRFILLFPGYLAVMATWFFLASAVVVLRPAAEDRSTPLKIWSVAFTLGLFAFLCVYVLAQGDLGEARQHALAAAAVALGAALPFYALVNMNEASLPPPRVPSGKLRRAWFFVFGPGAMPTLRFQVLLFSATAALLGLGAYATPYLGFAGTPLYGGAFEVGIFLVATSIAIVSFAFGAVGMLLRALIRNGLGARIVALVLLSVAAVGPLLLALMVDNNAFDDLKSSVPIAAMGSAVMPTMLALAHGFGELPFRVVVQTVPTLLGYTLIGLLASAWLMVIVRTRHARARTAVAASGPDPAPAPSPAGTPGDGAAP